MQRNMDVVLFGVLAIFCLAVVLVVAPAGPIRNTMATLAILGSSLSLWKITSSRKA